MARVQSPTPGGGVNWQFRCCDGRCGRTYQRPAPMCTHVNHGMESDDRPAVAAMHPAYAATFDPSVYVRAGTRRLLPQPPMMPPSRLPLGNAHRRAAKLTAVEELRRALQALDTADLGMVSDKLRRSLSLKPSIRLLLPPTRSTPLPRSCRTCGGRRRRGVAMRMRDLDYVPSWRLWVNRCLAGRCHSRTAAFLASGTVFALHKDDLAAREERAKTGEPLRVRPLGVGSVLVRMASAHALVQVGADAREAIDPTGFLNRMMPPSKLDPFLEAVDAANLSDHLAHLPRCELQASHA
eukprot:jgi/Tetstr1/428823/TSEL_018810.t1